MRDVEMQRVHAILVYKQGDGPSVDCSVRLK